jgi:hypothetical protein
VSDYIEADEADVLEQSTPLLETDEDPDEEYPHGAEAPEGDQLDDTDVDEPEGPGLAEG